MAAYTDNHHSYCNHLSISSGLTSGTQHHNQDVSISELVDHGSISFGRFAAESLAWEKWSVFSHNRCQEELEKFKAPGLVAQKKAFFEEYYKKIRAMKKLQAEQQEAEKSKLSQDENNITSHVETGDETNEPKEENNCNDAIQTFSSTEDETIQTTKDKSIVNEEPGQNPNDEIMNSDEIDTSSATVVDEELGRNPNGDIINKEEIKRSSATVVDKAEQVPVLPIKTYIKSSQQNSCDSSTVKLNANRPRDPAAILKAKDTVTSARDKTKLDYRNKKDAIIKTLEKQKASLDKDTSGKSTSQVLSARANPKLAKTPKSDNLSSHRPSSKARSSTTHSQTSIPKDRPTSSSSVRSGVPKANLNSPSVTKDRPTSSYSVRSGVPKANLNSPSVVKDRPTSSYSVRSGVPKALLNSTSVIKDRPTSSHNVRSGVPKANLNSTSVLKDWPTSSSSVRIGVPKANLNSKGSANKIQTTSNPKSVTNGVDNAGPGKRGHAGVVRKSLEPSSFFMMPKSGLPENQKPKVGLTNSPARIKSKQNLGNESGLKNDSKGGNKTKILPWQSADMTQARSVPRPKTQGWR